MRKTKQIDEFRIFPGNYNKYVCAVWGCMYVYVCVRGVCGCESVCAVWGCMYVYVCVRGVCVGVSLCVRCGGVCMCV